MHNILLSLNLAELFQFILGNRSNCVVAAFLVIIFIMVIEKLGLFIGL